MKNGQFELLFRWAVGTDIIEERLAFESGISAQDAVAQTTEKKQHTCGTEGEYILKEVLRVNRLRPSYFQTKETFTRINSRNLP